MAPVHEDKTGASLDASACDDGCTLLLLIASGGGTVASVTVPADAVSGVLDEIRAVAQVPDPRWEGMKDWLADFTAGTRGELARLDEPDADDAAAADAIEWALLAVARKMTEMEAGK